MTKKGTGWIPDYPDVRDFTLDNDEIKILSEKIQTQGSNADVESLADTLRQALKFIAQHQEKITAQQQKKIIPQQQKKNEDDTNKINTLIDQLSGKLHFINVELNNVLKVGMSDSEVLLIKNYLQRIISTWKLFQPTTEEQKKSIGIDTKNDEQTNPKSKYEVNYTPKINDTIFDKDTRQAVIKIFQIQQLKHDCSQVQEHDGFIDKYDMELLKLLASGADITRDIEPFKKLIKENVEFYEGEIKGKFCQQCDCCFQKNGNISSNCLVFFLEKINEFDIPNYPVRKVQTYQGILCIFLYKMLENIEILILSLNDINTSENDGKKLKDEDFNRSIQEIGILISGILANKSHLVKFISSFTESLENPDFSFKDYELSELTEITKSNILTLESFGFSKELSDKYSTNLDIGIREIRTKKYSEIKPILEKELPQILSRLKYLMGLLYTVCPPRIPDSLFPKKEIPISTPIPNIVNKLLINKLYELQPKNTVDNSLANKEEINFFLRENNDNQALPLLNGLDEILLQVLMPLGQYNNLSKAVEDGIVKIQSFLSKNTENSEKSNNKKNSEDNIREIIRETMRKYNVTIAQDYSLSDREIDWTGWDYKKFQEKIGSIFKDIKSILKSSKRDITTQDFLETQNLLTNNTTTPSNTLKNKHLKKPLFKISTSSLEEDNIPQNNPVNTSEERSEQLNNSLLFPISSDLLQQIKTKIGNKTKETFLYLPEFVDLSYWCSPVEDQGSLNSCTAHAGIALIEYAQKKSSGNYTDASPLFLYQVTRNLMQREGDSGASVRDTMKAMVAFGVCPEEYWPYNEDKFNEEPTSFCYSFAENYKTIKYFRLDYGQISKYALLSQVKLLLVAEIPCIFGFTLYNSVYDEVNFSRGHIPLPSQRDKVIGGHTVVAVGYHDRKIIENEDGERFEGALLIRNSWGNRWGQGGYGWMPYDYIIKGLTADWWSLLKAEWLATGSFGAGASAWNADKGGNGDNTGTEHP